MQTALPAAVVAHHSAVAVQVVGVNTVEVEDAESLVNFFADCFENRAVAATKMNDQSSRSHAIYTVLINRTVVDVSEGGDKVKQPGSSSPAWRQ